MVLKLEVNKVSFSYKQGTPVFKNISFTLNKGDVFCILGHNGAGKSTLLSCIGSLFTLDSGNIRLDDKDISTLPRMELAKKIGYIPQFHNPVFPYSVFDFVLMGRTPHIGTFAAPKKEDKNIAKRALEAVGIDYLIEKPYSEISGGERQLVMFAKALAQEPDIILLDEPTSHLDFGNQFKVLDLIEKLSQNGFSIIMTSHFPDHAFIVSSMVGAMKDQGFIDIGPANDVITEENMKKIYDLDVKITTVEKANRKVCVPLKHNQAYKNFNFSK
ncbi:MAG: ABC transporter ATP-binding protein [Candidatus Bathyarchaeota archaeon]|nr:ABC transporter ATP-binding protein [Candidatus Bathyarchaeota archaeon]